MARSPHALSLEENLNKMWINSGMKWFVLIVIIAETDARLSSDCRILGNRVVCKDLSVLGLLKREMSLGNRYTRVRDLDFRSCTLNIKRFDQAVSLILRIFPRVERINMESTPIQCKTGTYGISNILIITDCPVITNFSKDIIFTVETSTVSHPSVDIPVTPISTDIPQTDPVTAISPTKARTEHYTIQPYTSLPISSTPGEIEVESTRHAETSPFTDIPYIISVTNYTEIMNGTISKNELIIIITTIPPALLILLVLVIVIGARIRKGYWIRSGRPRGEGDGIQLIQGCVNNPHHHLNEETTVEEE